MSTCYRLLCLALFHSPLLLTGQTQVTEITSGQVRARIYSGGRIGSNPVTSASGFFIPYSPNPVSPLYNSGLWLSGIDADGQDRCAAHYLGQAQDFSTGPLTTDGSASLPPATALEYDRFWTVNSGSVETHQAYFNCLADPNCDMQALFPNGYSVPSDFLSWPAHGDVNAGQDTYLAPFVDVNGDGNYDPFAGDYPCVPGDLSVYHIFNDLNQGQTGGLPMGIEVHMTTFIYFASALHPEMATTLFTRYRIINRSIATYSNFRIGIYADFDLGCYSDDRVGTDVGRNLIYVVNATDNDASCATTGYGTQPPAFGLQVLRGPRLDYDGSDNTTTPIIPAFNGYGFNDGIIDNERHGLGASMYFNGGGTVNMTGPTIEAHYVGYMRNRWKDGSLLTYGGSGYGGSNSPKFAFPGASDPTGVGTNGIPQAPWTEINGMVAPGDRNMLALLGPITMDPGSEQEILVAYDYARAASGGAMASLTALQEHADEISALVANIPGLGAPGLPCSETGLGIRGAAQRAQRLTINPNPVADELRVILPENIKMAEWSVIDARGSLVMRGRATSSVLVIDADGLPAGIYTLRMAASGGVVAGRFVKH